MLYSMTDTAIRFDLGTLSDTSKKREEKRKEVYQKKKAIKEALNKGHKLCTSCNEEKSLSEFNVDKKTYTGYSTWCKNCKKTYNKKYLKEPNNDSSLG